jgi:amino acid transporter/nucleotide-binding universal stress UspA family protein
VVTQSQPAPRRSQSPRSTIPAKLLDRHRASGQLGYLLAWSVVFADIGTSIYYVPGLLFSELGGRSPSPAAAFVLATGLAVILLALKYVEISGRYPEGGGVVWVATDAFGPSAGVIGGILICIGYFLTGAISAVSGMQYLAGLMPALDGWIVPGAAIAIALLGVLNYVGIRESAMLTVFLAAASFLVNLVLLAVVVVQLEPAAWALVRAQFQSALQLPPWTFLVGFSSSWLAYSGLESISQIAPALRPPREQTAFKAMMLVMAAILLTSPLATALCTALLSVAQANPDRFLFELGSAYAPRALQVSIVATAAALLMGAANTAIIGCYHVFLAIGRLGYLPHWVGARSRRFNTPYLAIAIAVLVPVAVIAGSRGATAPLGHMYAFGLLGAFTLTSVGLDRIRLQERKLGAGFYLGALTSLLVATAWVVNLLHQRTSTLVGGTVTVIGFLLARAVRGGRLGGSRTGHSTAEAAEREASRMPGAAEIVTVEEALDMRQVYRSSTLISMRSPNLRLFQEAVARVRGSGERVVYLLFVDEIPGMFYPPKTGPSREAHEVLASGVGYFREADIVAIPIWRMAHDAGASIAGAARRLGVSAVLVGTSQRSAVWHLLRGNVLRSLIQDLPQDTRVWICN